MSDDQTNPTDWLPADVSLKEAVEILQDPDNLNFYRFMARVLENTDALDQVTEYVDPELLVKEFHKIRNHMKHGELDGSRRPYWEKKIKELSRELGLKEDVSVTGAGKKPDTEADPPPKNQVRPDEPTPVDPGSFSIEETPSSAADTGKPEQTAAARREQRSESEMMGGVQDEIGFNEQVSEAARSVSEELRELRQKRDKTRNELAENADLPLQLISEIERGRKELTYDMIERYAEGLNMSLELDFQKKGNGSRDILQQVKKYIDETIKELDVNEDLAQHTRMVLHQLAEDGLYQHRFPTLRDALNYLEEAVREFSIRDDSPDPELFSNETLFHFLRSGLNKMEYSDLAYDENIKIVGQKVLERFHE